MKKILITLLSIITFITFYYLEAKAGGPLAVKGGMAISYGSRPYLYRYDLGPLGMFSNSEAIAIIEDLYGDWESVPTAQINFKRDNPGSLNVDVDETNFDPILNAPDLLGYTAVVFDHNGALLNAFLGEGAGNSVLGLSGPVTVNTGPLVNQIAESQAVFNGRFVNGTDAAGDPETTVDSFKGTIIHETGHGIGLDHSQINIEAIKPGATQELRDSVPLEFPIAVNDLFLIRRDDASSISLLYPNDSELNKFGKIEGRLFRADGKTPVLGGNIIARNINDPKLEAVSCVSDYLDDGSGSYTLFALPPGSYKIEIEPIDLSFTGGSGVGPHTENKSDLSFQNPVPKGFYTGADKPITEDESMALIVEVMAGQTIKDANIIAATSKDSTSTSGGTPTKINEIEPNNSPSTAQVIKPPATITGNASPDDISNVKVISDTGAELIINDLYKITVGSSGTLSAHLVIESDLPEDDLDLILLDSKADNVIDASGQTGNVDELIETQLDPGTYLIAIGAFSGSASYTLNVSLSGNGPPSVTLSGKDTILLQPVGKNIAKIMAVASNFPSNSKCQITKSSDIIKVKPSKFTLGPSKKKKTIRAIVNHINAKDLIENESAEEVTISISCNNGASDEFDLFIEPSFDDIAEERVWIRSIKK